VKALCSGAASRILCLGAAFTTRRANSRAWWGYRPNFLTPFVLIRGFVQRCVRRTGSSRCPRCGAGRTGTCVALPGCGWLPFEPQTWHNVVRIAVPFFSARRRQKPATRALCCLCFPSMTSQRGAATRGLFLLPLHPKLPYVCSRAYYYQRCIPSPRTCSLPYLYRACRAPFLATCRATPSLWLRSATQHTGEDAAAFLLPP